MRTAVDLDTGAVLDQEVVKGLYTRSGQVVSRCDLLFNGGFVTTLSVSGGGVRWSRSAQVFAQLSGLTVNAKVTDLPTVVGGRLVPSGWEIRAWAGMRWHRGGGAGYIDCVVPLGTFPLEQSQVDALGVVDVSAWDRSSIVAADLLLTSLVWPGEFTSLEGAVEDLVRRSFPLITMSFSGDTHTCPVITHERGANPWSIITDAATSVGHYARFDGLGNFVWGPEPDLSSAQPVASFVEGAGLIDINATVTSRGVHNAWTVEGSNPDKSDVDISATVYDLVADSPTRWEGVYGRRPKPAVRMELVDTVAKAEAAALLMRAAEIGFGVDISANVVPNWLVEPGDAVTFKRAAAGIDGVALVDDQSVDLGPGTMELRARTRQVTE